MRLQNNNIGTRRYGLRRSVMSYALSYALLGIALGGCSVVEDPEPSQAYPDAPEGYRIGFTLSTPGIDNMKTRAPQDGAGHDQQPSYFPDMYENAVNVNDVAVYLFAASAPGSSTGYSLIYSSEDDESFRVMGSPVAGYTVLSKIPFDNYQLDPTNLTTSSTLNLRMVVLANQHTQTTGAGGAYPSPAIGATYDEAMNRINIDLQAFTLPERWNPGNTVAGEPRYIPMYGRSDFTVNALDFYHSESWQTVGLSDVLLLRSLAKIEVNDNINNQEATADRYPRIESAVLRYSRSEGLLLPYGYLNYQNGTQVENVNLAGSADSDPVVRDMTVVTGTYYADGASAGRRVRFVRGYCPEQTISNQGLPEVMLAISPAADATADQYSYYTVPLYGYNGGVFNWGTGNQLLRNHVYRINVNSVGTPADITVQVMPWESENITWDYTDNPGFTPDGYIQWDAASVRSIDNATARVYVNPIADGAAVCTFHMTEPNGATWRAFLIDTEGDTQGAFHFVDAEGNIVETPSGIVGDPVELRILPSQPAGQVTNAARLQVLVTTADGRTIIADLCNGQYGNNTYFTIVQQGSGI